MRRQSFFQHLNTYPWKGAQEHLLASQNTDSGVARNVTIRPDNQPFSVSRHRQTQEPPYKPHEHLRQQPFGPQIPYHDARRHLQ